MKKKTAMPQFDVIGIGVNVVDILVQLPSHVEIGGKQKVEHLTIQGGGPAGTGSCVCAALGWRTGFVAQFGDDMLSQVAQLEFETRGICLICSLRIPRRGRAQRMSISIRIPPNAPFFFTRDGYQYLKPTDLPIEAIQTARVLLIDGYEPEAALAALEGIQGTPCRSVLDVEQGDEDDLLRLIALATDVILPMATARMLTGKSSPEMLCKYYLEKHADSLS
jgi:sugar/nucleoside kinase (ribokinase family)